MHLAPNKKGGRSPLILYGLLLDHAKNFTDAHTSSQNTGDDQRYSSETGQDVGGINTASQISQASRLRLSRQSHCHANTGSRLQETFRVHRYYLSAI